MYTLGVRNPRPIIRSSVKDMSPGDIGYVRTINMRNVEGPRTLVLRGHCCLINLKYPDITWTWGTEGKRNPPPFEVELLQSGDVVTLTVE